MRWGANVAVRSIQVSGEAGEASRTRSRSSASSGGSSAVLAAGDDAPAFEDVEVAGADGVDQQRGGDQRLGSRATVGEEHGVDAEVGAGWRGTVQRDQRRVGEKARRHRYSKEAVEGLANT